MKRILLVILCMAIHAGCQSDSQNHQIRSLHVETGLDVLVKNNFSALQGRNVGLITNHTARTSAGRHIADVMHKAQNVNLLALFGPEHGIRGHQAGGIKVDSNTDSLTGIPVHSLYSDHRKPTAEMLDSIDVLVFDIQDVGARFYTYIYTMALAMEAAALYGKQFIVLDRPNPINGIDVQGPLLREGFESFVGLFKLPVRHGMTVGELALMFEGEGWINGAENLDLKVVPMSGWQRAAWLDETDVPWLAPSPNMLYLSTAIVYPGICLLEGTNISEGRGTDKPFEKIGAPWIVAEQLASEMNTYDLAGVTFKATAFMPTPSPAVRWLKYKDQHCNGLYIDVTDRNIFQPVQTGITLIWTIQKLYPASFDWSATIDRLYGSDILRKGIDSGKTLDYFIKDAALGMEQFMQTRQKYLLYR